MASLFDQGVQQRNMNNILFYGGLMLVCAFLSLFSWMQFACYAYARLVAKTFAWPFSKRSNLHLKILTALIRWSVLLDDDGRPRKMPGQMVIRGSVYTNLMVGCGLFHDTWNGHDLAPDHRSRLHHHEDNLLFHRKYLEAMTPLNNSIQENIVSICGWCEVPCWAGLS